MRTSIAWSTICFDEALSVVELIRVDNKNLCIFYFHTYDFLGLEFFR